MDDWAVKPYDFSERIPWIVLADGTVVLGERGQLHDDLLDQCDVTLDECSAMGEIVNGHAAQMRPMGHDYEESAQETYDEADSRGVDHMASGEDWAPAWEQPSAQYKFMAHKGTGQTYFEQVGPGMRHHHHDDILADQHYAPGEPVDFGDWNFGYARVTPNSLGKMIPEVRMYDHDPALEDHAWQQLQQRHPDLDWTWGFGPHSTVPEGVGSPLAPALANLDLTDLPPHLGGKRTADFQGWTNWETWNTKLMMDNERETHDASRKLVEQGDRKAFTDWVLRAIIGPHNQNEIEGAREWNSIPQHDRLDYRFEDLKDSNPQAADIVDQLGFGPNVEDSKPTLIDPELVNWDEIWNSIAEEIEENRRYEQGLPASWQEPKPQVEMDAPGDLTIPNDWISKTAAPEGPVGVAAPYEFKMPLDVEQRFVDMYQCPECSGHLRQGDGLYCEHCGWQPRKVAGVAGESAERASYLGRLMRKYIEQGESWGHIAQMAQAFIARQWPNLPPQEADQVLRSAAQIAQTGREPSIEDMGQQVTIPAIDQFAWGGAMGNDPRWSKLAGDDWAPNFTADVYPEDYNYYKKRRPWVYEDGGAQAHIGQPGEFHPHPMPGNAWFGEVWEDTSPPTFKVLGFPRDLEYHMGDSEYQSARDHALAQAQRTYFQQQDKPEQREGAAFQSGNNVRHEDENVDTDWEWEPRTPYLYDPHNDLVHWGQPGWWHSDLRPMVDRWETENGVRRDRGLVGGAIADSIPHLPGDPRPHAVYERSLPTYSLDDGQVNPEHDRVRTRLEELVGRPIMAYENPDTIMGYVQQRSDGSSSEGSSSDWDPRLGADMVPGNEGHWVWLDGQVGFGGEHHEVVRSLAQRLGYDPTTTSYISNMLARNAIPDGHAVAVGTMRGGYPQIWNSTRDRNAVWDDVARAHEGFAKTAGLLDDAHKAYQSLVATGGFSLTQSLEAASGQAYFTSVRGYETTMPLDAFTPNTIVSYRASVLPELRSDASFLIGGWLEESTVYLDLSRAFETEHEAVEFGRANGQKAVWDGFNNREIRLDDLDENELREARIRKLGKSVQWAAPIYSEHLTDDIEKTAMADRTGNPELDKLIEEFLQTPQGEWTTDIEPIEALRDPENAHGMCDAVTEQFVEFAKARGFKAYVTHTDLDEMGYKPSIEPFGEVGFNENDEMQYGFYPEHTIATIVLDDPAHPYGREFYIDFTATQYGYTDHPKVTSKTSMAERTGDPTLDALIEQFMSEEHEYLMGGENDPMRMDYRKPEDAAGECGDVSEFFRGFLRTHGINATCTADDDWNRALDDETPPTAWGTPDEHGYGDRTIPGHDDHTAVIAVMPTGRYMIDWTASQYGYTEFPMVQRLDDQGAWQRSF